VFVAYSKPQDSQVDGVPEGTIISSDGHEAGGSQSSQQQPQSQQQPNSSVMNYMPINSSHLNVNPTLNDAYTSGNVQVLNMLDVPQASNNMVEQLALASNGILDGLPDSVSMFEFSQWETYFQRVSQYQQRMPGMDDVGMQSGTSSQPQPQYHYPGSSSSGM